MPTVNLAPLGLGELLDQTFSYFRKHFWLFVGIMVLPEGLLVALNVLVQVSLSGESYPRHPQTAQAAAQAATAAMRVGMAGVAVLIPYFIVYALALGATTYALSEVYLGRTTTIRAAYRAVWRRFWRVLGVIFAILLRTAGIFVLAVFVVIFMVGGLAVLPKSMAWVAILVGLIAILGMLVSGVLAIMFLVRYSVAVPALVLERLSARQALKRSVALTRGFLWRLIIVAFLMAMIRAVLVSLCQAPFAIAAILVAVKGSQPGLWLTLPSLLVGGVGATVTAPLLMISFAIAYYDLRVRKEGFDLQLMMSNLDQPAPLGAPGATATAAAENRLEDSSILSIIVLTVLTAGVYQPIWFLQRRKALNRLNSAEKLGAIGLSVALVAFIANFCIPVVGAFVWGSSVQAENALGPLHPLVLVIAAVIMVVYAFKVRRILLDHLAPSQEGMFSASVRFQYDDLLSRMGTFFLGICYLQYKINGLLDRLASVPSGAGALIPLAAAESLPPPIIS